MPGFSAYQSMIARIPCEVAPGETEMARAGEDHRAVGRVERRHALAALRHDRRGRHALQRDAALFPDRPQAMQENLVLDRIDGGPDDCCHAALPDGAPRAAQSLYATRRRGEQPAGLGRRPAAGRPRPPNGGSNTQERAAPCAARSRRALASVARAVARLAARHLDQALGAGDEHLGVDLGSGDTGVAELLLQRAQVLAFVQTVRREGVTKGVRGDARRDARVARPRLDDQPESLARQALAAMVEKQRAVGARRAQQGVASPLDVMLDGVTGRVRTGKTRTRRARPTQRTRLPPRSRSSMSSDTSSVTRMPVA